MGTLRFAHPTFFALRFTLDFKAPLLGLFCGQKKISPSPSFSKRGECVPWWLPRQLAKPLTSDFFVGLRPLAYNPTYARCLFDVR